MSDKYQTTSVWRVMLSHFWSVFFFLTKNKSNYERQTSLSFIGGYLVLSFVVSFLVKKEE